MTLPGTLVLAVGNPSRGDDAAGPLFVELLAPLLATKGIAAGVELLTDFQLQIEHALDCRGRLRVFFVDASTVAPAPFECRRVLPGPNIAPTTHAMAPSAVLETYRQLFGEPPDAWLIAIPAERFELGEPLSARTRASVDAALDFFLARLVEEDRAPLV